MILNLYLSLHLKFKKKKKKLNQNFFSLSQLFPWGRARRALRF